MPFCEWMPLYAPKAKVFLKWLKYPLCNLLYVIDLNNTLPVGGWLQPAWPDSPDLELMEAGYMWHLIHYLNKPISRTCASLNVFNSSLPPHLLSPTMCQVLTRYRGGCREKSDVGPLLWKLQGSGDRTTHSWWCQPCCHTSSQNPAATLWGGFASHFIMEALKPREGM